MAEQAFWENDKSVTEAEFWKEDKAVEAEWWKEDKATDSAVPAMAAATRATVGVVGRAIAVAASDRSANVPQEGVTVWERGEQKWYPSQEAADTAFKTHMNAAQARAAEFENPLLTLPRLDIDKLPEGVKMILSMPGGGSGVSDGVKVAAGAYNALKALPEFFTTPVGVSLLASGNLPAIAQRLIAGGFAVDMAVHTPEQVMALAKAVQSGDTQEISETATSLGLNVSLTALTGRHALKTPLETVAPLTAEAVAKVEPIETKAPIGETKVPIVETVTPLVETIAPKPETPTPLTTEAVAKVVEPAPVPPLKGPKLNTAFRKAYDSADPQKQADILGEMGYDVNPENGRFFMEGRDNEKMYLTGEQLAEAKREFIRRSEKEPVQSELSTVKESLTVPQGEQALTTEPVVPKWTAATRAGVDLGKQTLAGIPDPIATIKAVIALAKEASPYIKRAGEAVARAARSAKEGVGEFVDEQMKAQRMTDYRRSVLNWSSKLQTSFGEADSAQRDIRKAVPDENKRNGITNWIQAGGDADVLRARANATADPKLKAGYEAALSLTPEEIAVANDVRVAFEELGQRGETYDVLNSFKENYVTQTWDLGRGPATGGSRTLKEKFRFSKASTFPTYFDGEQAGYVPKTKDISKLLPMYLHEMNSVIAARQLVQEMAGGVGSDGRPLVAARGGGVPVEGDGGKATLIMPKKVAKDTGDYKVLENQPALTGWRWASKDTEGNPIFLKADLALHPEAYGELKKVLGQSAIKEWYQTRSSAAAQIPKLIVKAIDLGQGETKRTMLGFFAPFHQVQEGTHAVGHRINPFFSIPKIDLIGDAAQRDATRHGLMLLPDRTSAEQFMEGFRHSGLISMIPKIGPAADWYSHYLFQEYIPGLKFKTYQHILERNSKVYEKELASGELKPEDVKVLSSEQANAAYGHLNYADLARNPTIMHAMRLVALAPDFLEARAKFAAQAITGLGGAKVGREQVLALATLAIAQATTAWIAAQTTGGTWDAKHPFEMVNGDRRYSMRSVPEDIAGLIADSRKFFYSRLSPLVGKGIVQGLSGVDYKGDKVSAGDTAKELAQAPIPLPLRGFLGTSHRNLTAFEELAGSVGLRISRYLPEDVSHAIQLRDEVDLWINRSKKLDTDEERAAYLQKQVNDLPQEDRKKAVVRIKQRTAPGVRKRVR